MDAKDVEDQAKIINLPVEAAIIYCPVQKFWVIYFMRIPGYRIYRRYKNFYYFHLFSYIFLY